jgi:hypothetical protein
MPVDADLEDECAFEPIQLRLPPAFLCGVDDGQSLGERSEARLGLLLVQLSEQGEQRRPDLC